ncbi:hypothetical protein A2962_04750 [Candidatus Woesebacteria bacterium RIFCSPLOWO2_01_FULL_39_61]|uniref:General secretion pathway GspH domain-containing protein n=1 Tax=Candidatus Woesebacteria bacterium RIFCSPHIGHO2_02_FULL_39_13 TaxID=1802505 RepID=A0A1F7Z5A9_9BACT|nr:MAG: hypothetical protein A2692_01070 [Candidatus Woesebacteria bacterium RIFCSPHIGHO2_01_FULL_39_95]OGM34309.1 MAG: hypothetical protein A3D01_00875 [Candidatus Woesebacteria bacterium RIFCSPHIGHO2_02_FULL_39_13]OGM39091.1 MAG: hypothetical protein A3E13_01600 [Candidatus Woesebacteria bacterium RIFCSPHIGHO2_12_FULL_40_20]OGM68646.1 MAG: hypothetical protein A2962_04750 [Candidatus Woesebacteria bacterium RIFCSPLOWO2_01_FULL_39_61]OGM73502.1 MAG: hypothetical protein A3H19_00345 [Candidatus
MNDSPLPNPRKVKVYFRKNEAGFTLVELIIVIVTMVLIFSLGYANYRGFQRRQHLESAVRMVMGDLRLAQGMALAGRKPEEPVGNACQTNVLGGYVFSRTTGYSAGPPEIPASYTIYAVCPDWGQRVAVKGPIELPENINLLAFGGGNRFIFRVLGRGTDRNTDIVLTFNYVDSGVANRSITITPAGNIQ